MTAILRHELRIYFRSLTAYVFGAFLLLAAGIGAMLYNINAAVSNFEYVLSFGSIVFIIIVPIITMRVLSEERKQRTDQLLFSLPVSTTDIVLGKYLALIIIFVIPLAIISLYPLIFSSFGDVYLLTSYGSLLAFLIMGASLIALGVFVSSLTENQGLSAGICVAVIAFNYFSVSLSEYVSATALGSALALCVLEIILGVIVYFLTRNETLGYAVSIGLMAITVILFFIDKTRFEGLLSDIMKSLSVFERFTTFVNGAFDMSAIVFYFSVIVFFLFLSVQSLEKRRYN